MSGSDANDALRESNRILANQLQDRNERISQLEEKIDDLLDSVGGEVDRPSPPSNDEIVSQYHQWKDRGDQGIATDRSVFRRLRDQTGEQPLPGLTAADIESWIHSLNVKATTIYDYLSRIAALFDWMERQPWGPDTNPAKRIREDHRKRNKAEISRTGQNTGTILSPDEFVQLIQTTYSKRDRALLVVGAKTGLRRKQLCMLERADVDLVNQVVLDRYPKGVGSTRLDDTRADEHPIDEETAHVLSTWLQHRDDQHGENKWLFPGRDDGDHLSSSRFTGVMNSITERAETVQRNKEDAELAKKFADFTGHDLRRCFTTWLNRNGCQRDIIAALRGDADEDMIALYTQYGEETIREEYETAIPSFGLHRGR